MTTYFTVFSEIVFYNKHYKKCFPKKYFVLNHKSPLGASKTKISMLQESFALLIKGLDRNSVLYGKI